MQTTDSLQFPGSFTLKKVLGINFYVGDLPSLLALTSAGGLVVFPSAPVLVQMARDQDHRIALEESTIAVTDSGLMVLTWLLLQGEFFERISGLRYMQSLICQKDFREPGASFWIVPSEEALKSFTTFLARCDINIAREQCYLAPHYKAGAICDEHAAELIEKSGAHYVVICLGGGVQERLGYYLNRRLNKTRAIICTGAAIAFMSGLQTNIPNWIDRLGLGWLARILSNPSLYMPRYIEATRLPLYLAQNGAHSLAKAKEDVV